MKIHETLSLLWGIQPIPPTLPLVERDGEMTLAEEEPEPLDWLAEYGHCVAPEHVWFGEVPCDW